MYAPAFPPTRPRVVSFFKIYALVLGMVYLLAVGLLCFLIQGAASHVQALPSAVRYGRVGLILLCAVLSLAFLAVPFLPRRPWVWGYGLACIVLGMTSFVVIPLALPLLLFWIKPETKSYFAAPSSLIPAAGTSGA
jgi:hypothetical protein